MNELQVQNLTKNFSKTKVLNGVSFNANQGDIVTFIGSSGTGKTTLLRCLNFLEILDGGMVTLNGKTIFDASLKTKYTDKELAEMRSDFGLVFQSFNLFPQYTVYENITLASKIKLKSEYKAKKKVEKSAAKESFFSLALKQIEEKAEKIIKQVGLEDRKDMYPCVLSGGQQQRVAIARALMLSPKVLCFDEPTSALDPRLSDEIVKLIRRLKDEGRTILVVTHDMNFAKKVSDKVFFMSEGVIVENGTPDEMFSSPKTQTLKNFLSSAQKEEEL